MSNLPRSRIELIRTIFWTALIAGIPLIIAYQALGLNHWNLSIPLSYNKGDATWQLNLTKTLLDTGWILNNPYLGAPGTAHFYINAAAQTSALHSVLMLALSPFIHDAVRLQQIYYILNFPLICFTSFVACRLLGIARLPAFTVGLLYAFTTFRFDQILYSFLSNYFMVPLALVVIIWILCGEFSKPYTESKDSAASRSIFSRILRSKHFLLGLLFIILTAVSDGYYAFFTLLLLGFSIFARTIIGDWRRPLALAPAAIYIIALLSSALALQWPLHQFKETHHSQFYPQGVKDPALFKHPFEAEVYSSSLKMLIAPISEHQIKAIGALGKWIIGTSDAALIFKHGRALVPLGTLGSLLFITALILILTGHIRRKSATPANLDITSESTEKHNNLLGALLSLTLFIFLCSTFGGIGSLVALVFPTIRDYERFPLFLIFVLYLMGALFMTKWLRGPHRLAWTLVLFFVTTLALFDQIPRDASKGSIAVRKDFLAESHFVQKIEAILPKNAMVFQFPYSQYLRDSKYYGWGSFAGVRLYLHSHDLRWSNGGAKNSPADDWDYFISQLPPDDMITEAEAAGFKGFVIDRTVVKAAEYDAFRHAFLDRGDHILDDAASELAFVKLRDPGYRLTYDHAYKEANGITVTDPARLLEQTRFSRYVNAEALKRFVASHRFMAGDVILRTQQPALFADSTVLMRGTGQVAIKPITDMRGQMSCKLETAADAYQGTIVLRLDNQTPFDWRLNHGPFPIRIGLHILQADGKVLRWDDGYRVPTHAYIRRDSSETIRVSLGAIPLGAYPASVGPLSAQFALVQDGNAWFGNISCTLPLQ